MTDNLITNKRGSNCSKKGREYEEKIYDIVKCCAINNKPFNMQNISDLGGCSALNDLICIFNENDVPIEIKKCNTPDWMQCSLKYDNQNKKWYGTRNGKIPEKSRELFDSIINGYELFNGVIPPFLLNNKITHSEWLKIKKQNDNFKDHYINCPNDTIKKLYLEKGCKYIQISAKGLYHLGEDICNFGAPEFLCEQQIRIRIKVHNTANKNGYCNLSVTCACQPKNIENLENSKYSLDDIKKLPEKLKYNNIDYIATQLNALIIDEFKTNIMGVNDNDRNGPNLDQ